MTTKTRRATIRMLLAIVAVFAWAHGWAAMYAGMTLPDAIAAVRSAGLEVLYSSELVNDRQMVLDEPVGAAPAEALAEMLAPHGLVLQRGPDNLHIIVPAARDSVSEPAGAVFGVVKLATSGERLPGAEIVLKGTQLRRATAGPAGEFSFTNLRPGVYDLYARDADREHVGHYSADVQAGRTIVVVAALNGDRPLPLKSIVVNASTWQLFDALGVLGPTVLDREQMLSLPKLGDDVMRTVNTLPGTAFGGLTAKTNIRGGDSDEVLLRFDGLRLYDPFHLKDFQSITSIVDGRATSALEVYTGGFPARYGERMSGVVEIRSLEPLDDRHTEVGFSFFNSSFLTSGVSDEGNLDWLVSLRRGNTDIFLRQVNAKLGEPVYFDAVAKLGYRVSDSLKITASALRLSDNVELSDSDTEEVGRADYEDAYYWLSLDHDYGLITGRTLLSHTVLETDRSGIITNEVLATGRLDDHQRHMVDGLQTDWHLPINATLALDVGAEYRRMRGRYDFDDEVAFALTVDGAASARPTRRTAISLRPRGEALAVYGSVKWQPAPRLVTETGARWSRDTLSPNQDDTFSPRLSLLYKLTDKTQLRAGWGRFFQPERIDELQVADGVRAYSPPQRAEHLIFGVDHRFESGVKLRVEAYRKRMTSLRPRHENLFNTFVVVPELQPDRTRIAPDSAVAEGLEMYLTQRRSDTMNWWASYSWASASDRVDGVESPRSWDQSHALSAGVSWHTDQWDLSLSTTYHSGWPITPVSFDETADTDLPLLVPGPRNSVDLSAFHTIDARVARRFEMKRARLSLFAEVSNLSGRNNPCCVDYDIEDETGPLVLEKDTLYWLGVVPSIGFLVEF